MRLGSDEPFTVGSGRAIVRAAMYDGVHMIGESREPVLERAGRPVEVPRHSPAVADENPVAARVLPDIPSSPAA